MSEIEERAEPLPASPWAGDAPFLPLSQQKTSREPANTSHCQNSNTYGLKDRALEVWLNHPARQVVYCAGKPSWKASGRATVILLCDECAKLPRFQNLARREPLDSLTGQTTKVVKPRPPVVVRGKGLLQQGERRAAEILRGLETLGAVCNLQEACDLLELDRAEVNALCQHDSNFAEKCHNILNQKRSAAVDRVETKAFNMAMAGNDKLAQFLLTHNRPEVYRPDTKGQTTDASTVVNIGQLVITPRGDAAPKRLKPAEPLQDDE